MNKEIKDELYFLNILDRERLKKQIIKDRNIAYEMAREEAKLTVTFQKKHQAWLKLEELDKLLAVENTENKEKWKAEREQISIDHDRLTLKFLFDIYPAYQAKWDVTEHGKILIKLSLDNQIEDFDEKWKKMNNKNFRSSICLLWEELEDSKEYKNEKLAWEELEELEENAYDWNPITFDWKFKNKDFENKIKEAEEKYNQYFNELEKTNFFKKLFDNSWFFFYLMNELQIEEKEYREKNGFKEARHEITKLKQRVKNTNNLTLLNEAELNLNKKIKIQSETKLGKKIKKTHQMVENFNKGRWYEIDEFSVF